jgi:hypothetical protein
VAKNPLIVTINNNGAYDDASFWSIACVVERGRKVIEVRPEWTPPQPGNDALSYKGLVEHVLFLFRKVVWKRNRIARLDHAKWRNSPHVDLTE